MTHLEKMAQAVASTIFYHNADETQRKRLEAALLDFALEIQRMSIEP